MLQDPKSGVLDPVGIGAQNFDKALCDLGASVSMMPKAVFDQLNYTELTPTPMCWHLPTLPPGNSDDAHRCQLGWQVFHEPRINPQAHGIPL